MRMRWTPEHLEFLRTGYLTMRIETLTAAFNLAFGLDVAPSALKAALTNHKIRSGRPAGLAKGERSMLTGEQHAYLQEQYPHLSVDDLTEAFNQRFLTNYSPDQIKSYLTRHGILSGRSGCFQEGHRPWNTGTKGLVPPNSGQFRPGNVPANSKEMGFERVNVYGYLEVKVAERNPYTGAPTRFKLKHIAIWEAANGPIPRGCVVRFIDGDKLNCALENLELASWAENLRLNQLGYADAPAEAKPTVKLMARLEVKAFRGRRKETHQEGRGKDMGRKRLGGGRAA